MNNPHPKTPGILRFFVPHGAGNTTFTREDAPVFAAQRADELFEGSHHDGAAVWKRKPAAIEELQRMCPE